MERLNRRAIIMGASATVAALTIPASAGTLHPDAELFAALARWKTSAAELAAWPPSGPFDDPECKRRELEFGEAVAAYDELMLDAMAIPALTIEGLQAKADAITRADFLHDYSAPELPKAACRGLLADIAALHGPLTT